MSSEIRKQHLNWKILLEVNRYKLTIMSRISLKNGIPYSSISSLRLFGFGIWTSTSLIKILNDNINRFVNYLNSSALTITILKLIHLWKESINVGVDITIVLYFSLLMYSIGTGRGAWLKTTLTWPFSSLNVNKTENSVFAGCNLNTDLTQIALVLKENL